MWSYVTPAANSSKGLPAARACTRWRGMASDRIQRQIDRLLDEAEGAVAGRDWAAVRGLAGHVLTLDPENAEARAFLAAAERGLGELPPVTDSGPATSVGTR